MDEHEEIFDNIESIKKDNRELLRELDQINKNLNYTLGWKLSDSELEEANNLQKELKKLVFLFTE